jgi:two-component system, cell cycle sensor histidine kinase and response regulator CckA
MKQDSTSEHLEQKIEELEQGLAQLESASNQYRHLVDSTSDSLYLVDEKCRYLFMNNNHLHHLNLTPERIDGYSYSDFHSLHQSSEFAEKVRDVFATGHSASDEHQSIIENKYFLRTFSPVKESGNDDKVIAVAVVSKDITERRRAEQAMRKSEEKYRLLIENSNEAIFVLQNDRIKFATNRLQQLLGYSMEDLADVLFIDLVLAEDRDMVAERQKKVLQGDSSTSNYTFRIIDKQTVTHWTETNSVDITWEDEPSTLNFMRDVTRQKKTEARLLQAQKMESIGTLAGGMAHDFNNLLMGIQGHASLALLQTDPQSPGFEHLKTIESLVVSGADLTKQLLGFARGGKYEMKAADLNALIYKASETIGRTKKEITIHRRLADDLWLTDIDQGQIEQVLINLCVNAWQAMPGGGDLYLATSNVVLGENRLRPAGSKTNAFVKISVTDTGVGMDEKTKERIFEPFFTTKEMGRGTGLGLASVYGIIKNHNGFINVYSEKGQGTTFNIYLPASSRKEIGSDEEPLAEIVKGTERILIIDDEAMIIKVARELLETLGYTTISAGDGLTALKIYKQSQEPIDLVLLDMVMPEMGGGEVFDELKKINPDVKVLLSSGYSINGQASKILNRGCVGFIQKPFTIRDIAVQIRKIFDSQPAN